MKPPTSQKSRLVGGTATLLTCLAALGASSCDQGARNKTASTSAAATSPPTKDAPKTASAQPIAPSPSAVADTLKAPEPKAYDAPEEAHLGTLPADVGLAVGTTAPDFELPDAHGKPTKLSELAAKSSVLLVFYRGGW